MNSYRTYRYLNDQSKLHYFTVKHFETDLSIGIDHSSYNKEIEIFALEEVARLRSQILLYSKFVDSNFLRTFNPLQAKDNAPDIVCLMCKCSMKSNTGPMSSVAGAFAQFVAHAIQQKFTVKELIIENGGDIYISCREDKLMALYAGKSLFSNKLGIKIPCSYGDLGIATSSGTVGHSHSLGKTDALTIICKSTALADAYATAFANKIQGIDAFDKVINEAKNIKEILGIIIIKNDAIGCYGKFEIVSLRKNIEEKLHEKYS